ncbi:hypothetical protein DV515_00005860 [Chloebia gouldiae]|uniref:Uncharacterized protein n=1 Tax=Chloebia gouldiae TaxID=44316 RepID=A0A3L8SM58_CHLGU|nr:hypothetical protein DV515_00005860 [Chloebia gouldiae]
MFSVRLRYPFKAVEPINLLEYSCGLPCSIVQKAGIHSLATFGKPKHYFNGRSDQITRRNLTMTDAISTEPFTIYYHRRRAEEVNVIFVHSESQYLKILDKEERLQPALASVARPFHSFFHMLCTYGRRLRKTHVPSTDFRLLDIRYSQIQAKQSFIRQGLRVVPQCKFTE